MPIPTLYSGLAGDIVIDTSVLITNYKFSHFVIGASTATITVAKIRGVDVSVARNYKILDPGYVMSAGNNDYFDVIQFGTLGKVEGFFYPQAVSPVINAVTVDSSGVGDPMTPIINFSNSGNPGSKLINWRVRNYTQEASIRNAAIQAAYDASGTTLGAFNFNELILNANKTYNESDGTIFQSGQANVYFLNSTTNTSVNISNLTYYGAVASDNVFDVTLTEIYPYVWTHSPLFQIYP